MNDQTRVFVAVTKTEGTVGFRWYYTPEILLEYLGDVVNEYDVEKEGLWVSYVGTVTVPRRVKHDDVNDMVAKRLTEIGAI